MKEQLNDSSTAETVKVIKTFGITILIVIAATIWISAYENLISRVEDLESKIDSTTTSSNNYSYSHITTFENKTPEEGIDEALLYYDIKHPTIVKAQAILETAHFSSDLCVKNNNLIDNYNGCFDCYIWFYRGESPRVCCHWDIVFRLLMDTNNSEVLI